MLSINRYRITSSPTLCCNFHQKSQNTKHQPVQASCLITLFGRQIPSHQDRPVEHGTQRVDSVALMMVPLQVNEEYFFDKNGDLYIYLRTFINASLVLARETCLCHLCASRLLRADGLRYPEVNPQLPVSPLFLLCYFAASLGLLIVVVVWLQTRGVNCKFELFTKQVKCRMLAELMTSLSSRKITMVNPGRIPLSEKYL